MNVEKWNTLLIYDDKHKNIKFKNVNILNILIKYRSLKPQYNMYTFYFYFYIIKPSIIQPSIYLSNML